MNNIHYKFAYTFYVYTRLGNARINKKAHFFCFFALTLDSDNIDLFHLYDSVLLNQAYYANFVRN